MFFLEEPPGKETESLREHFELNVAFIDSNMIFCRMIAATSALLREWRLDFELSARICA